MNPRSGGGKVAKFQLKEKAEALGAEVALLEGPETADVATLARKAVAGGADLLGVADGDGTQALVAGIAAEHGLPFLVISVGTHNHFASPPPSRPSTGPGSANSPSSGDMDAMCQLLRADRAPSELAGRYAAADSRRGRNDPCPCGSGRKWKRCHQVAPAATQPSP